MPRRRALLCLRPRTRPEHLTSQWIPTLDRSSFRCRFSRRRQVRLIVALERMITDALRSLQARTDAKIRYAEIHLEELEALGHPDGSEFDRAHQEAFLLHLLGTRDAFVAELNAYYGANLPVDGLSPGKLRDALAKDGKRSNELAELFTLERNDASWFSIAKSMRDHTNHVGGVARAYYLGGPDHRKVKLRHPKTGVTIEEHFLDTFKGWVRNMRALVNRLRQDAMNTCGLE